MSQQLTVRSAAREDLFALHDLELQVRSRLAGRVRDFHLVYRQDGLVLQGQTRTYYAKQLAQQAVMTATSLPIRANNIDVS